MPQNSIKKIEDLNREALNYGLKVRFVTEDDAEKILELRTDVSLSRHLHSTHANIEKQKEYIRDYKVRELNGLEYYLAFSDCDSIEPQGFYRVHSVDHKNSSFAIGSWIFERNILERIPILADILSKTLGFILLNLETCYFDVRRNNKTVLRYHKLYSPTFISEDDEENNYFFLKKEDFIKNSKDIIRILI